MWSMDVWNDLGVFPTLILCVIVLWLTYMYVTWPYGYFKRHGIPGPPPLPVIGNWKDITKKVFHDLDIEFIEKYGKVVGNYNGWLPELIVADVDLVKQFTVKQASEFIDRRPLYLRGTLQNSVLDTTGEEWRRQRSLISPFFSTGKLKQNAKRISRILANMERSLNEMCQSEQEINGKDFAISITTDVICSVGFGIEVESLKQPNHPMVKDLAAVIRDFGPGNPWFILTVLSPTICKVLDYFNVSMFRGNAFKNIEQIVTELIKKKEQGHQEAQEFVTALVKAHEEAIHYEEKVDDATREPVKYRGMTDAEIVGNAFLFIGAGSDTTANTVAYLLYFLATNQDCQETLLEEIQDKVGNAEPSYDNIQQLEYLECCINETLRMYPPATRFDRQCVKDTKLGDMDIPKGMLVTVPVWYLQHLPEIWPEPDQFNPLRFTAEAKKDRNPYYFLPFGVGPRQCLGMRFAMLEIKMVLVKIMQNYKIIPNDKTVPIVLKIGSIFPVPKDGLWFSIEKREY